MIDLDIRKFFDSVPYDLILKAVDAHTDQPWVLLYVGGGSPPRSSLPDGLLVKRERGTPQGARGHAPNAMGNFEFDVTLSYRRLERPRRVAKKRDML